MTAIVLLFTGCQSTVSLSGMSGGVVKGYYTAEDFGITTIYSAVDFNGDGVDDFTNLLLGAREDAENLPAYDGAYWEDNDGYPPEEIGVCTDLIWRAFRAAGYCLKDMVDMDIANNVQLYPRTEGVPDTHIDWRRVPNLHVFFSRYAVDLTLDVDDVAAWQPGDIIVYDDTHIAIVSDRRNANGLPYILHNSGQPVREEDKLDSREITGHYRFDASQIDSSLLIAWGSDDCDCEIAH